MWRLATGTSLMDLFHGTVGSVMGTWEILLFLLLPSFLPSFLRSFLCRRIYVALNWRAMRVVNPWEMDKNGYNHRVSRQTRVKWKILLNVSKSPRKYPFTRCCRGIQRVQRHLPTRSGAPPFISGGASEMIRHSPSIHPRMPDRETEISSSAARTFSAVSSQAHRTFPEAKDNRAGKFDFLATAQATVGIFATATATAAARTSAPTVKSQIL